MSKATYDQNIFYSSDSDLMLKFELIEKEFSYDSAEILLFNETDKSFVTRMISKDDDGFVYQIDDDIIQHFGKWQGQLQLVKNGEIYTSKPFQFTIENDLSSVSPPQLIDINSWATLKQSAIDLIDDMQNVIAEYEKAAIDFQQAEDIRLDNEATRKNLETIRQNKEIERERNELSRKANEVSRVDNEVTRQENETTRKEAEQERVSAEQERIEAELLRVERDNNLETVISDIEDDILHYSAVKLENIIKNGDFSNGLEGWSGVRSDLQLSNLNELGLATISNPQSNYPKANYNVGANIINGHIYYAGFYLHDFELSSTGNVFMQAGLSNYNNALVSSTALGKKPETYLSSVKVINSDFTSISISGDSVTPNSSEFISFSKVYLIDLTKAFGVGNEPSKEIIDWIISENGYFNELTLRRDDIQQYEINQLRKAVIALGGMI